jgi:hypothetical protein
LTRPGPSRRRGMRGGPKTAPMESQRAAQTSHSRRPAGGVEPSSRLFASIFLPSEQFALLW